MTRPKKRYGRRLAIESVSGTYITVMPCRACGAVIAYQLIKTHDETCPGRAQGH